jgi:hypothetical protein
MKTLEVLNSQGHRFKIVLVTEGDPWGAGGKLTHKGEPMVEFYSLGLSRPDGLRLQGIHGPKGFFVSRFNISDIDHIMQSDDLALRFSENMYRDGYFVEGWIVRMAVKLAEVWA